MKRLMISLLALVLVLFNISTIYAETIAQTVVIKASRGVIKYLQTNDLVSFALETEVSSVEQYINEKGDKFNIVHLSPKGYLVLSSEYTQDVIIDFSNYDWQQQYNFLEFYNIKNDKPDIYKEKWDTFIRIGESGLQEIRKRSVRTNNEERLLTTVNWNQSGRKNSNSVHYNSNMPGVNGINTANGNAYAGCAAVAMGIVMNYHSFPKFSPESCTLYNWNNSNFDVSLATLFSELNSVGNSSYDTDGTGMSLASIRNTLTHFGYSVETNSSEDAYEMYNFCKNYINNDKPVILAGFDWDASILGLNLGTFGYNHATVVNGYKKVNGYFEDDYYLYINYGWGGNGNRWWKIDSLADLIWSDRLGDKYLYAPTPPMCDFQRISVNGSTSGSWSNSCMSINRSGKYAQFYYFTLSSSKEIQIDLESDTDTYLFLLRCGMNGDEITHDDDGGSGTNSRIIRNLSSGTYTIEATTYSSRNSGNFTLSLNEVTSTQAGDDCFSSISVGASDRNSWTNSCTSTHRSGKYAKYYTLSVLSSANITIDLESSIDTFLYLLSGDGNNGSEIAHDDDGGNNRNSRISRRLSSGVYTIEATTYGSGETGSFTLSISGDNSSNNCIESIDIDTSVRNSWNSSCTSTHRSNRYARYYSFSLSSSANIIIDLESSSDTYLFLLNGIGVNGNEIEDDDDGGNGRNSRIYRHLSPGTYTIEATTYDSGETGDFILSIGRETSSNSSNNCINSINVGSIDSNSWVNTCNSVHRSGRYALYYTFSISRSTNIQIDLESSTDAYLFLLNGNGMNGSEIEHDDDGGSGRNSRIRRTLSAGTYTVEATTYNSESTGNFSLSIQQY